MEKHHRIPEIKNTQGKNKGKNHSKLVRNSRSSSRRVSKNILKSIFAASAFQPEKTNCNSTTANNSSGFKPSATTKKNQ